MYYLPHLSLFLFVIAMLYLFPYLSTQTLSSFWKKKNRILLNWDRRYIKWLMSYVIHDALVIYLHWWPTFIVLFLLSFTFLYSGWSPLKYSVITFSAEINLNRAEMFSNLVIFVFFWEGEVSVTNNPHSNIQQINPLRSILGYVLQQQINHSSNMEQY